MDQQTLQQCLNDQLRDLYDAEKQLTKALPKLAKAASSEDLAEALRSHLEETQGQVTRLESVFQALGLPAKSKPCKAMRGLIEEGSEVVQEHDKGEVRDLGIIAAAQRVEHYEISAYGTAKAMAQQLGNDEAVQLIEETEEEESAADSKLTEIAMAIYESEDAAEEDVETEEEEEATTASRRQPQSAGMTARKAAR